MDLAPRNGDSVSLLAFDRDHINQLLTDLAEVDTLVGQPVPKTRMGGGAVGIEVAPERLVEVARTLRNSLGFDMLTCVSGVDFVDHIQCYLPLPLARLQLALTGACARLGGAARGGLAHQSVPLGELAGARAVRHGRHDLKGHPDLRRILLDDDFQGFPMRRNFRATPITLHDRATTQVDAERAISGEQQRNQERIVPKHLGQGDEERHPSRQADIWQRGGLSGDGAGTAARRHAGRCRDRAWLRSRHRQSNTNPQLIVQRYPPPDVAGRPSP